MYQIKLSKTPNHEVTAEYTIPGDLVILRRHSYVDGEHKDVQVGISVANLIGLGEILKLRVMDHVKGIDPPDRERIVKASESYMDEM
jgi:hypothetical protein